MDIPLLNPTESPDSPNRNVISGNALNVTRVTGLAALITAVLTATTPIFSAEATDPTALRVAIPAIQGLIVIASLLTAAIIVAVDIRSRATATLSLSSATAAGNSACSKKASGPSKSKYSSSLNAALNEISDTTTDPIELSAFAHTLDACEAPPGYAVRNKRFVLEIEELAAPGVPLDADASCLFQKIYRRIQQTATDLR